MYMARQEYFYMQTLLNSTSQPLSAFFAHMKNKDNLPRNFVITKISSRLKCPICYDTFLKPRKLHCGHTFCKSCLQEHCKNHKNPQHVITCPLCRTAIDPGKIGRDLIAEKIINELEVTCPKFGCPWKGESQLLQTHYKYQCPQGSAPLSTVQHDEEASINIISSQESFKEEPQEEAPLDLTERIAAQEYRYWQPPVNPDRILLISRGMQTIPPPEPVQPVEPIRIIRRRRRRTSTSEQGIVRRRRRPKEPKLLKIEESALVPKKKISREEEMRGIEQLYQTMGFNFNETYEDVTREIKASIVNVDTPRPEREKW